MLDLCAPDSNGMIDLLPNIHFQQKLTDRTKHLKAFPMVRVLRFTFSKKLSSMYVILINSHLKRNNHPKIKKLCSKGPGHE